MENKELQTKHAERLTSKAARGGLYGIDACRESIEARLEFFKKSLGTALTGELLAVTEAQTLIVYLAEYQQRADEDVFFNKTMVAACYELILKRLAQI